MRGSVIAFLIVVAAATVGATGSATGRPFQARQHATSTKLLRPALIEDLAALTVATDSGRRLSGGADQRVTAAAGHWTASVPLLPRGPWVLKGHVSATGSHARVDAVGTWFVPRHVAFTITSHPRQRAHVHWYVLCNDRRADNETHTEATNDVQLPVGRVPPMPRSLGGPCTLYVNTRLFGAGAVTVKIYGY